MDTTSRDHLWLHMKGLPYFRALLRAVEARYYDQLPLQGFVVDLGCGDGHFAATTFSRPIEVGLDPWKGPLREASRRGIYRIAVRGEGARLPLPDGSADTVISNSVLEHIPDLDPVLAEVARVMRPDARFIFCVPNQRFICNLSVARFLDCIGLGGMANSYRRLFNRISRHQHTDDVQTWESRLNKAGLRIEKQWDYFSPKALAALEWGHLGGLPSLVVRKVFGSWNLVEAHWNFVVLEPILRNIYDAEQTRADGAYSFYIAARV